MSKTYKIKPNQTETEDIHKKLEVSEAKSVKFGTTAYKRLSYLASLDADIVLLGVEIERVTNRMENLQTARAEVANELKKIKKDLKLNFDIPDEQS